VRWFQRQIFRSMVMAVVVVSAASNTFALDLDALKAGVVKITTKTGQVGTGFIVRVEPEMLYIITAAHVIAGDPQPTIDFFSKDVLPGGQGPAQGMVLPGAQVSDDLRGLAIILVRGKDQRPSVVTGLVFESSAQLASGGEQALVIGHPGGGGDWALVKRDISNRVVHDITLDPGVASRFSGGPILVDGKVVGMVMTNRGEFGLGITHKNLLNYLDGIGIEPQATDGTALGGFVIKPEEPSPLPNNHRLNRGPGGFIVEESPEPSSKGLPSSTTGQDGAPMVLVPDGEFLKGSRSFKDNPPRKTLVKAFYIDTYEVTVERYAKFLKQGSDTQRIPAGWDDVNLGAHRKHPVAGTNYFDAYSYCRWVGKRLPTNDEWEKAARGTDGRKYPWGNEKPHESMTNFNKNYCFFCNVYDEKISPIGSFQKDKSPFGVFDMAGNVTEWVDEGNRRGGDWRTGWPGADESMELARLWPSDKMTKNPGGNPDQGFRCAQDAP